MYHWGTSRRNMESHKALSSWVFSRSKERELVIHFFSFCRSSGGREFAENEFSIIQSIMYYVLLSSYSSLHEKGEGGRKSLSSLSSSPSLISQCTRKDTHKRNVLLRKSPLLFYPWLTSRKTSTLWQRKPSWCSLNCSIDVLLSLLITYMRDSFLSFFYCYSCSKTITAYHSRSFTMDSFLFNPFLPSFSTAHLHGQHTGSLSWHSLGKGRSVYHPEKERGSGKGCSSYHHGRCAVVRTHNCSLLCCIEVVCLPFSPDMYVTWQEVSWLRDFFILVPSCLTLISCLLSKIQKQTHPSIHTTYRMRLHSKSGSPASTTLIEHQSNF